MFCKFSRKLWRHNTKRCREALLCSFVKELCKHNHCLPQNMTRCKSQKWCAISHSGEGGFCVLEVNFKVPRNICEAQHRPVNPGSAHQDYSGAEVTFCRTCGETSRCFSDEVLFSRLCAKNTCMCVCVCLCLCLYLYLYLCLCLSVSVSVPVSVSVWKTRLWWFLGDLNHTGIKRQNMWTQVWKCSICLILVMFGFFHSHSGCSWCMKCQKNKFLILHVFMAKKNNMANMVKFGYDCINGFIAQKQLISAEASILRKCRQSLGLKFRISDWLLW